MPRKQPSAEDRARGKRVFLVRKMLGLSQEELAKLLSRIEPVTRGAVGNWERGGGIKRANMDLVSKATGAPFEWLHDGRGEPPTRESLAIAIDDLTRVPIGQEFSPDQIETDPTIGTVTGVRGIPTDASPQIDVTGGLGAGGVTIINPGVPGQRGMTFSADVVSDYWRLPSALLTGLRLHPHDLAIIPVEGDSMADTLDEGDFVFVDTRHRIPSPDGIYALGDEFGGIVVKRLEMAEGYDEPTIKIISDNPRHEPKFRTLSDTNVVGRVIRRFGVIK